jgi:hypothetical protein
MQDGGKCRRNYMLIINNENAWNWAERHISPLSSGFSLKSKSVSIPKLGKRPKFPSGVGLGSSLSMASWINQREQELNVVFVSVGQLRRSGGL